MPTVSNLPARCKQLSRTQLIASFDTDFGISPSGKVTVAPEWRGKWLVPVSFPVATGITHKAALHKRAAPVFEAWFRLWSPEVCKTVKTFDGSFVPRLMRQAKNLPEPTNGKTYTRVWGRYVSRHTRGIAIDLNASGNRQGTRGDGSLDAVIELARTVRVELVDSRGKPWTAGIVCGADWKPSSVTDVMHFEVGVW